MAHESVCPTPVIACEAVSGKRLIELKLAMSRAELPLSRHAWDIPAPIASTVAELQATLTANPARPPSRWFTYHAPTGSGACPSWHDFHEFATFTHRRHATPHC